VASLDHHVDSGHNPAIGGCDDGRVIARADRHIGGLRQARNDASNEAELTEVGEGLVGRAGIRDDDLPSRSGTVWHVTVQAYILIQTEVGKAAAVAAEIQKIKGVTLAEDVTGPYDVIVRSEAKSVDELGKLVVAKVQSVPGITRTLTCPVVHL
jgi:DNA-binding Lrp family transcriptional regulator